MLSRIARALLRSVGYMMADVFTCSLLLIGRLFYILQEAPFSVCWWLYIMGVWLIEAIHG